MGYFIYGLYSSDNDEIRYVGQTKNPLKQRLSEHISDSLCGNIRFKSHKNKWIRSVYNRGEVVLIKLIEEATKETINEREIYWIDYYKTRTKLTNQLSGGNSGGIGGKVQNFLSYDEAKKLIQKLSSEFNIVSISTYMKFLETHNEYRKLLPKYANDVYRFRGTWVSWRDYLNSKFMNNEETVNSLIDLETLKQIVQDNKIENKSQYKNFREENDNSYNGQRLPAYPERAYKMNGWCGFQNFWYKSDGVKGKTNSSKTYPYGRGYFTLYGLKKYLWQFDFKTPSECIEYLSAHKHPRIPENIPEYYIHTGEWKGKSWNYLLQRGDCCCEEVFRRYLKLYNIDEQINSVQDWLMFCRNNNVSKKIPRRISLRYGKPESSFFTHIEAHPKKM